jgi:hypothetical protein
MKILQSLKRMISSFSLFRFFNYSVTDIYAQNKHHDQSSLKNASLMTDMVQENARDKEAVKRVRASIKEQQQSMDVRALKPHDPTCLDPISCTKDKCFVFKPDIISRINTPTKAELAKIKRNIKKNAKIINELNLR